MANFLLTYQFCPLWTFATLFSLLLDTLWPLASEYLIVLMCIMELINFIYPKGKTLVFIVYVMK